HTVRDGLHREVRSPADDHHRPVGQTLCPVDLDPFPCFGLELDHGPVLRRSSTRRSAEIPDSQLPLASGTSTSIRFGPSAIIDSATVPWKEPLPTPSGMIT